MRFLRQTAAIAGTLALALSLTLATGASAQVASLHGPGETPAPEGEADAALAFEDREEALLAFAQCMRDHGVEMDDPVAAQSGGRGFFGGGPGGRDLDQFGEGFLVAREACDPILEASRPEIDPELQAERLEEQLLLAECIRQNGYPDYPDPSMASDGRLQRLGGQAFAELGIDRRSEEFQAIITTCRDELGIEQFGPGGLGGPRGGN
jgi:hypothetical protein